MRRREALARAAAVQRAAARLGFDWPRGDARLWHKLAEEIDELHRAVGDRAATRDELGDLLFTVVNLARHLQVDPARALTSATAKFERRFAQVRAGAKRLPPRGDARRLEAMEALWREAKRAERARPPRKSRQ